jgi:L-ribulose-5-phosphate 3-epimerase
MTHGIGVCSWSLRPASASDLAEKLRTLGIDAVQLALDPIRRQSRDANLTGWDEAETLAALKDAGIRIASGMMAMQGEDYSTLDTIRKTGGVCQDATWETNLSAAGENAALALRMNIDLVTFHAGFIPHDASDPQRTVIIERLRQIIDCFASVGVRVALETGQETAATLLAALKEINRPTLGVNFDPANMILYAMGDPVDSIALLARNVAQIHIKDATKTTEPGTWGTEVTAGTGDVDWPAFFAAIGENGVGCDLMIEREAGEDRTDDIRAALDLLGQLTSTKT